eukprot:TRINITY_DN6702_c0_g5_i1.p1 TRINITY_DN6702_c0_g5~~TRINITY_DN6702_c0_g5_i1.p1  ORF type:complete len:941 (+),score=270.75 TRINITY_DN6702_c0_g5_i1:49-2871(+)
MLRRTAWRLAEGGGEVVPAPTRASRNGEVVPLYEGGGEYLRNTALRKPLPGYSRRWKWYAGHIINEGALPFAEKTKELCRGSWFAVPHVGRRLPGTPAFHVLTANHIVHPFNYPDLFDFTPGSAVELMRYYGEHDVASVLKTASPDGDDSHKAIKARPDLTYAHEKRHLDIAVLHPSPKECEAALQDVYSHLERQGTDAANALLPQWMLEEFVASSDALRFPFHFQLLAFDCRPLQPGEKVMLHGHTLRDDPTALTPLMVPTVVRGTVRQVVSQAYAQDPTSAAAAAFPFAQQESMVIVEPEKPLEEGMCGGPVLRDGRVVGMTIASVTNEASEFDGCALAVSAAAMRDLCLRVEESWRYPEAPSSNWLKENGYMDYHATSAAPALPGTHRPDDLRITDGKAEEGAAVGNAVAPVEPAAASAAVALVEKPVHETGRVREVLPERYQPPSFLPRPTSSMMTREYIKHKFQAPLPEDYAPPQLPPGHAAHVEGVLSRDRTNPYGALPPDSGMHIPSLPLFPGYAARRGAQAHRDDEDLPGWVLKYGSADNFYKAHGIDPSTAAPGDLKYFRNYISPHDVPGRGWGLYEDRTEAAAEQHVALPESAAPPQLSIPAGGAEAEAEAAPADPPAAPLTSTTMDKMGGMDRFFGQEEYVRAKDTRRRDTLEMLAAKRTAALEAGDAAQAQALEAQAKEFVERERELDWHRGDTPYISSTQEELLMLGADESAEEDDIALLPADDDVEEPGNSVEATAVKPEQAAVKDTAEPAEDPLAITADHGASFGTQTRVARQPPPRAAMSQAPFRHEKEVAWTPPAFPHGAAGEPEAVAAPAAPGGDDEEEHDPLALHDSMTNINEEELAYNNAVWVRGAGTAHLPRSSIPELVENERSRIAAMGIQARKVDGSAFSAQQEAPKPGGAAAPPDTRPPGGAPQGRCGGGGCGTAC